MRCEDCQHWDNSVQPGAKPGGDYGACRFAPPVADDRSGLARWPFTEATDRCASFTESDYSSAAQRLSQAQADARKSAADVDAWEKWWTAVIKAVPEAERSKWPPRPHFDDIPF